MHEERRTPAQLMTDTSSVGSCATPTAGLHSLDEAATQDGIRIGRAINLDAGSCSSAMALVSCVGVGRLLVGGKRRSALATTTPLASHGADRLKSGVIRSYDWPQLLLVDSRQDAVNTLRHAKRCGALALLDDVSGLMGALHRRLDNQHREDPHAVTRGRDRYTFST